MEDDRFRSAPNTRATRYCFSFVRVSRPQTEPLSSVRETSADWRALRAIFLVSNFIFILILFSSFLHHRILSKITLSVRATGMDTLCVRCTVLERRSGCRVRSAILITDVVLINESAGPGAGKCGSGEY